MTHSISEEQCIIIEWDDTRRGPESVLESWSVLEVVDISGSNFGSGPIFRAWVRMGRSGRDDRFRRSR